MNDKNDKSPFWPVPPGFVKDVMDIMETNDKQREQQRLADNERIASMSPSALLQRIEELEKVVETQSKYIDRLMWRIGEEK